MRRFYSLILKGFEKFLSHSRVMKMIVRRMDCVTKDESWKIGKGRKIVKCFLFHGDDDPD